MILSKHSLLSALHCFLCGNEKIAVVIKIICECNFIACQTKKIKSYFYENSFFVFIFVKKTLTYEIVNG